MRFKITYASSRNSEKFEEEIEALDIKQAEAEAFRLAQLEYNLRARNSVESLQKNNLSEEDAQERMQDKRLSSVYYKAEEI